MTTDVQYIEWLVRLLAFVGGVASTLVGSWISSKIHVYHDSRKSHLDDLKQRVLVPLRDGLEKHFRALVFHLTPVVFVQQGVPTEFREKAKVTESPEELGDVLVARLPGSSVFGPLDSALLQDATKRHFSKQTDQVNTFVTHWMAHAGECHAWVRRTAQEILHKSGLPAFPNRSGGWPAPYAMHYRLAVFLYKRLFRIPTAYLVVENTGSYWALNGESATLAVGPKEQLDLLVDLLDKLLESEEANAQALRGKAGELQKNFQELIPELGLAIASRRLRGRCDLVTFF